MMAGFFADTSYWVALWQPNDGLHEKATFLDAALVEQDIVTTQMVLGEALDSMAGKGDYCRSYAVQMVLDMTDNPFVEIIPQTDAQFRAAVERYAARSDQRWSLTDCASFLAMEERGITQALAHDRDFEQAGFVALLREARS